MKTEIKQSNNSKKMQDWMIIDLNAVLLEYYYAGYVT